jgi:TonB family protein
MSCDLDGCALLSLHMDMLSFRYLLAAVFLTGVAAHASAQTLGGTVVDKATHRPARALLVSMVRGDTVVANGRTDSLGVFYLNPSGGGVFRLYFGDPDDVQFIVDSVAIGADEFVQRSFAVPVVFFDFEVETQVQQVPTSGVLRYPEDMRMQNVEGEVLAQFIVDTSGTARPGTLKIIRSNRPAFTEAVRRALGEFRFIPATIRGVKVAQVVQQPFTFSLGPEGAFAPAKCIPGGDLVHPECQRGRP